MERDIHRLASETFHVLVIGGGVHGAAIARECSRRSLRVALIEGDDFAAGTSSNSLKILHGGFRHVGRLDVRQARASVRARREWMRLAPRLVAPLPCVVGVPGRGATGPLAFRGALALDGLLAADRNRGLPLDLRLQRGRMLAPHDYARFAAPFVGASRQRGALWWDALALDTERLVLGLVLHAAESGACVANRVEAIRLLRSRDRVHGVEARDRVSGREFEVRAGEVILTGRAADIVAQDGKLAPLAGRRWCAAVNVVLNRDLGCEAAIALPIPVVDSPAEQIATAARNLFLVPWRGCTLAGTHYTLVDQDANPLELRRRAALELVDLIQRAAPAAHFRARDVVFTHWGWLPLDSSWRPGEALRPATATALLDGRSACGAVGVWLVRGAKFTTALEVARTLTAQILRQMPSDSVATATAADPAGAALINPVYGIEPRGEVSAERVEAAGVAAASAEQAQHLEDAILRRTGYGSTGYPGRALLEACARGMGHVLGWSDACVSAEISAVGNLYREQHFWDAQEPSNR